MFNLATGPNVEVGMLGTRPCGLIAARPKGGNWAKGGLLGQLDWASLIMRLRPRRARGHGHGSQPTPEEAVASPGLRFRWQDDE
jgi:hypothetical protein